MTHLPASWTLTTLGELTSPNRERQVPEPNDDRPYLAMDAVEPHSGRVIELVQAGDFHSAAQVVKPGFTLYGRLRPYLNKVVEATFEGLCSAEFIAYPPRDCLAPGFLMYRLMAPDFLNFTASLNQGYRPRVNADQIAKFKLALPPLPEQRHIVAVIETFFTRIDGGMVGIRAGREKVSRLSDIMLAKAVNGELAEPSRQDSAAVLVSRIHSRRLSLAPKSRSIPPSVHLDSYTLPSGWEMASLGEVSYDWGYGTSTRCSYDGSGVPVLRIPNVLNGKVDPTNNVKRAINTTLDLSNLYLKPGDLLFIRTNGSVDLIGRVGVVDASHNAAFASYLIRFRLVPDGIAPDWVRIVVNSPVWRRFIVKSAASSAGQHNINNKILRSLPIPIPPMDEQVEIISKIDKLQDQFSFFDRTGALIGERARSLRESVLAHAFSGRLV